jgi:coiled-coil domain-containing protein 12
MTDDRRQRLKALAARAGRTKAVADDATEGDNSGTSASAPPSISFRNYTPTDKSLSSQQQQQQQQSNEDKTESMRPPASKRQRAEEVGTTAQLATSDTTNAPVSSSEALQNALEEAQREPVGALPSTAHSSAVSGGTNSNAPATVTSIAPKKINWDLKRDISEKLEKLERRTQKAIVRILKERLELEAAKAVDDDDGNDGGGDAADLD